MFIRRTQSAAIAAALALAVSATAQATNLYWEGAAGNPADLASSNYYNGSATVAPGSTDSLFIGNNGTATGLVSGSLSVSKLYIGDIDISGGTQAPAGPGTVSITSGSFTATVGGGGTVNYATIVGDQNTGALSIDGATTSFTSNGLTVGYGDDPLKSSSFHLINGTVTVNGARNIIIGDSPTSTVGSPGAVTVDGGTLKIASALQIGSYAAGSSYTQTGGVVTSTSVVLGLNGTDNSSFSLSGGTFTASTTFNVANSNAAGASSEGSNISFSGGTGNFGGLTMPVRTGNNSSISFSNTAVVNITGALSITDTTSTASNTSMTVSDSASVNVSNNFFLGRASTTNTSLTMTGGSLNVGLNFLLGTSVAATGVMVNQSAGAVTTTTPVNTTTGVAYNFAVGDTGTGDSTYNLSGTGTVTTVAQGVIGRQHGIGTMNQSGGTANFNNSLHLGDQQPTALIPITPTLNATGAYNLSGGALTAAVTLAGSTVEAFSIAPSGNGTFRVIGGDATMNVTGNMGVYANTSGTNTGTLTFQPQPNEALTTINVTGTATFNPGSLLQLDLSVTKPTQGLFTVLNAASIANNGTVSLPAGWNYSITSGGNGQLLKFFAGDFNGDGRVNADDYAIMDRGNAKHLTDGADGDLNADGVINSQDYLLIDSAYAQLGGSLSPSFLAARESEFGDAYVSSLLATVPEPTSLFAACGLTLPLLRRRQRNAR